MSISDIGNLLSQQFLLSITRDKLDTADRQASSGKKTDTIAGFGYYTASNSISARNASKLLDTYTTNLSNTKLRFETTDSAMTSIADTARELANQLRSQLQDTVPKALLLSNTAKTQLQVVTDKLNTTVDGRYIFSGQNFGDKAMTDSATLMANMGTIVTAAMASGTTTSASVQASANGVNGTGLGISNGAINGGQVSVKADDSTFITTGLNANNKGFSDILRGIAMVANLPQPTTAAEQANYWSIVNGAIALLDNGAEAVDADQSALGNQAKVVDDLIAQHSNTDANLQMYIGEVEDVDMAEAATKFANLQTQLQTSYSIISSMKDLSLVKYL